MGIVNRQSAYHVQRVSDSGDVDRDIYEAMRLYLTDLGISEQNANKRAAVELERRPARGAVDAMVAAGISIEGKEVLDLGAGLGMLSEELVLRGAKVTALEPGAAWARITCRRVERHNKPFELLAGAYGEAIPRPSSSFDLVASLQVLEHVQDPEKVLSEVWRVLRSGGHFYLACENYLAFREGHYQVPWVPLMPKWLGAIYLRSVGRSPQFLREAVTYVTYPGILRTCRKLGFVRHRDEQIVRSLKSKQGVKWAAMRMLRAVAGESFFPWLDRTRLTFKFGVYELFRKP
ncbi:MAG TPA: class I SAM-dependent methyltransferase [Vicinamibacterales bacterium]|nr:class I SAM-dependent methyltransferase [Vicinamibacterales bacterium]